jgi:hypothetical protein
MRQHPLCARCNALRTLGANTLGHLREGACCGGYDATVTLWRSLGEGRCFLEGGYASVTYLSASGSMGTGYSPVKQAVQ